MLSAVSNVRSTGPCAGKTASFDIVTKITGSVCKIGIVTPMGISPESYLGTSRPANITISVNTSLVPPDSGITSYIVDGNGKIWSQTSTNLNGSGVAQVPAPQLPAATYYVVAQYAQYASDGSPAG